MDTKEITDPVNDPLIIGNLVSYIIGCPLAWAKDTAELMIKNDFPINNIKTMGNVIEYLLYVKKAVLKGKPMMSWKEIIDFEKESKLVN